MKYLRAIEPEDLDLMYIVENDTQITRYSSTTVPLSRYALKRYIEDSRGDLFLDQQLRLTIVNPELEVSCGFIDLTDFSPVHCRAQVGIVLLPEAQGWGIATMALHELALYALEQGLKQLYAVVSEENIRGCELFLRAGYEKISILPRWLQSEGRFVDAILFIKQLTD